MSFTDNSSEAVQADNPNSLVPAMLPTPVKTPSKKKVLDGTVLKGKVVFPERPVTVDEAMPPTRRSGKKSRKQVGFSLDSMDEEERNIKIFTDAKDQLPELDNSIENPFYVDSCQDGMEIDGSGPDVEIQEAIARNEGMFYVL